LPEEVVVQPVLEVVVELEVIVLLVMVLVQVEEVHYL